MVVVGDVFVFVVLGCFVVYVGVVVVYLGVFVLWVELDDCGLDFVVVVYFVVLFFGEILL